MPERPLAAADTQRPAACAPSGLQQRFPHRLAQRLLHEHELPAPAPAQKHPVFYGPCG